MSPQVEDGGENKGLVPRVAGRPDVSPLVAELTSAIMEFQESADSMDEAVGELLGLSRSEMRCMSILMRGPRNASELAQSTALTRGAVTALVDRLEARGLVARHPVDGDRRRVAIALTPYAVEYAGGLYGPLAAEGYELTAEYSAAEISTLLQFLRDSSDLQMRHAARVRALVEAGSSEED